MWLRTWTAKLRVITTRKLPETKKSGDISTPQKLVTDKEKIRHQEAINKELILVSQSENECPETVISLLAHGAAPEYKDDKFHRTPLIWAVHSGRGEMVDVLLDNRVYVDTKDEVWDGTPLMWAIWTPHRETIIQQLINRGADLEATDSRFGRTPLLWAAFYGISEAANILLENGANVRCKDKDGVPALSVAVDKRRLDTARLLLDRGAELEATDKGGRTALQRAKDNADGEMIALLLERALLLKRGAMMPAATDWDSLNSHPSSFPVQQQDDRARS
jgi:ankyrin repeat protein